MSFLVNVYYKKIFGGAGLAAGITVGALLAQDMLGSDSITGVPTALFTLGSAGSALLVGRLFGLSAGFLTEGIGAILTYSKLLDYDNQELSRYLLYVRFYTRPQNRMDS